MRIEDDGTGLSSDAGAAGMGLRTMRYRAGLIGGKLEVGPGPQGGTEVVCRLAAPPTRTRKVSGDEADAYQNPDRGRPSRGLRGLSRAISSQPDLEVCGQAADTPDAMKLVKAARPNVVVADIQLKTGNGLDLIQRIKDYDESIRFSSGRCSRRRCMPRHSGPARAISTSKTPP